MYTKTASITAPESQPTVPVVSTNGEITNIPTDPVDGKLDPVTRGIEGAAPLSPEELHEAKRLVDIVIKAGGQALIANYALQKIRDEKLWRATHPSFEEFCKETLGFSEQRVSQLISAAEEYISLKDKVREDLLPTNESALRSLRKVAAANKVEVLELAAQLSICQRPTGPAIQQAWEQIRGGDSSPSHNSKAKTVKPNKVLKVAKAMAQLIQESSTQSYTLGELEELEVVMEQIHSAAKAKLAR
jgi:hypothetical protein